ncbi:protein FAM177A1 [Prionailurus iriomotensis]
MDPEPLSRAEGEAVGASGAAAAATFRESTRQEAVEQKVGSHKNTPIASISHSLSPKMNSERGFENVELGVIGKKKKVPRRVIHFVSGETMEEYSTDEDEVDSLEKKDVLPTVDPALVIQQWVHKFLLHASGQTETKLTWGPYLWFYMLRAATSTLSVCDFLGEKIASVLGISTPKYQYAIDEYYRMKKEEEEEEEENRMSEEAERQYQQSKLPADSIVQTDQPETGASSSFVNLNFEMEADCEVVMENKQNPVSVPP